MCPTVLQATAEQEAIIAATLATQTSVGVTAFAGTGKTATILLAAKAIGLARPIHYLVFGRPMKEEAQRRSNAMPNMRCSTVHGLAYDAAGWRFKERLNRERLKASHVAQICGIDRRGWDLGDMAYGPAAAARAAMDTVSNFCQSDDQQVLPSHVPQHERWSRDRQQALEYYAVQLATWMWDDLCRPDSWGDGLLTVDHDHYLKMFALSEPELRCDYIFLDEAQDSNPITIHILRQQLDRCRLLVCGDPHQSLYEWRSAVDAMDKLPIGEMCYLTQSWRFGENVADLVNPILTLLDPSKPPLRGNPAVMSEVQRNEPTETAAAYMSRTNAVMLGKAIELMDAGRKVHVVGGASRFTSFCYGILDLQAKPSARRPKHPWLAGFRNFRELLDHCKDESEHPAEDLVAMVNLVCQTPGGAFEILRNLKQTVPHGTADSVNVGTVHQFKGAEMETVALLSDFPREIEDLNDEELRLLYVAMTRGRTSVNLYEARQTMDALDVLIQASIGETTDDDSETELAHI